MTQDDKPPAPVVRPTWITPEPAPVERRGYDMVPPPPPPTPVTPPPDNPVPLREGYDFVPPPPPPPPPPTDGE